MLPPLPAGTVHVPEAFRKCVMSTAPVDGARPGCEDEKIDPVVLKRVLMSLYAAKKLARSVADDSAEFCAGIFGLIEDVVASAGNVRAARRAATAKIFFMILFPSKRLLTP